MGGGVVTRRLSVNRWELSCMAFARAALASYPLEFVAGTAFLDADCLWNVGPALRDAIEAGIVDGPRMTSGMNALLTAAGGTAGGAVERADRALP